MGLVSGQVEFAVGIDYKLMGSAGGEAAMDNECIAKVEYRLLAEAEPPNFCGVTDLGATAHRLHGLQVTLGGRAIVGNEERGNR